MTALWADPEWRAKMLDTASDRMKAAVQVLVREGRCGTQAMDKEKIAAIGRKYGRENIKHAHTPEGFAKGAATRKAMFESDPEYRARKLAASRANIALAHKRPKTQKQRDASRMNALRQAYKRYGSEFPTFEAYLEHKGYHELARNNHKVVSIEPAGTSDVYDMTVEKHHNFALSAGVFVHNCVICLDYSPAGLTCVTWGKLQLMTWRWFDTYVDEIFCILSPDWLNGNKTPNGFNAAQLRADLKALGL